MKLTRPGRPLRTAPGAVATWLSPPNRAAGSRFNSRSANRSRSGAPGAPDATPGSPAANANAASTTVTTATGRFLTGTKLNPRTRAGRLSQSFGPNERRSVEHDRAVLVRDRRAQLRQRLVLAGLEHLDLGRDLVAGPDRGLSYREAAQLVGIHAGTVTTRLFRARRQIVRALSHRGRDPREPLGKSARRSTATAARARGS
jgi:Sigma-70, region 4